jgi:hypothetical protein
MVALINKRKTCELLPEELPLKREVFPRIDLSYFREVIVRQNERFAIGHSLVFKKHKWADLRHDIVQGQKCIIFAEAPAFKNLVKLIQRSLIVLRLQQDEEDSPIALDISSLINEQNIALAKQNFPQMKKVENSWILPCTQKKSSSSSSTFMPTSNFLLPSGAADSTFQLRPKEVKEFEEEYFRHIDNYLKARNLEVEHTTSFPDNYVDISAIVDTNTKDFLLEKYPLKKQGQRWFLPCNELAQNNQSTLSLFTRKSPEGYYVLPKFTLQALSKFSPLSEYTARHSHEINGQIMSFLPASDIAVVLAYASHSSIAKQLQVQFETIKQEEIANVFMQYQYNEIFNFGENIELIRNYIKHLDVSIFLLAHDAILQLGVYFPNIESIYFDTNSNNIFPIIQNTFRVWPSIKKLKFSANSALSDFTCLTLSNSSLEELQIRSALVSGIYFDKLPLSLKTLKIQYSPQDQTTIKKLKILKNLEVLELSSVAPTTTALNGKDLCELSPSLKIIRCRQHELLKDISSSLQCFQKLEELELSYIHFERTNNYKFPASLKKLNCGFISHHTGQEAAEEAILRLENCGKLEELDIHDSDITGLYFDKLPPSLKTINCRNCRNLGDDAFLKLINRCVNLEAIDIGATQITGEFFFLLPRWVKSLWLSDCGGLAPNCIEKLSHLALEELSIDGTPLANQIATLPLPKTLKILNGQRWYAPTG